MLYEDEIEKGAPMEPEEKRRNEFEDSEDLKFERC